MIFKNIMIAVDGSEMSNLAMQTAISFAKDQHAFLHIVHVADEFLEVGEGIAIDFKAYEKSVRDSSQAILNKMQALAHEAIIPFETHLIEINNYADHISERLVDIADELHADLLIIGTHGRRGFKRLILGSVAEGVARLSKIPVLLIPAKVRD